jgi:hypothetical protein
MDADEDMRGRGTADGLMEMAKAIRRCYVAARRDAFARHTGRPSTWGQERIPRWDGGEDGNGTRHGCVWIGVARTCLRQGLDPFVLVAILFEGRSPGDFPLPNALLSSQVLDQYAERAQEVEDEIAVSLRVQHGLLVTEAAALVVRRGHAGLCMILAPTEIIADLVFFGRPVVVASNKQEGMKPLPEPWPRGPHPDRRRSRRGRARHPGRDEGAA